MKPPTIPIATYRVQLSSSFGFEEAARLVPYLRLLGVSHLYASPFLKARAGSPHGYDIVNHGELNPEFGGEQAFARLSDALATDRLGLILDFVPNHMAVGGADNAWWLDVLEWGPRSPFAASFDIEWATLPYRHQGGVLLPILEKRYGDSLESGEIVVKFDAREGSFSAWYYEHRLPIRPERYSDILKTVVTAAHAHNEPAGRRLTEIASLYRDRRALSRAQAPALKSALAEIEGAAEVIDRGLDAYRPSPADRTRALALHRLLERQHYRLAHWRVAMSEINYRRFFDISDLAGIRVEDPRTFAQVHRLVARLIREGRLQGLRLDHIDGLYDPAQYCRRLARLIRQARGDDSRSQPFYTVVEKILADGEVMPAFPEIAGTTGYEWLNAISRFLVDERGLVPLDRYRQEVTGIDRSFGETFERAKMRVLDTMLASEFTVLVRLIARIAAGHWRTRDCTIDRLRAALRLIIVHFPVYRTYITAAGPSAEDRATIGRAIAGARARWFGSDSDIFDFLADALTLDLIAPGRSGYSIARVRRFAAKFQQFTGPMMAKSLEDTAFYRYLRLLALNEVGGDPAGSALSVANFHRRMSARTATYPYGMTATATHDTKRGEDARTRLLALSEVAPEWIEAVSGWRRLNAGFIDRTREKHAPSPAHEYLLYQSLLGAWPLAGPDDAFVERMVQYAVKAAREGKVETSWVNPDDAYEEALQAFVRQILDQARSAEFIAAFGGFAHRAALIGALNGLVQLTLKATIPGIPDFYQGCEFWDLSLVDPDNRRPVDFRARAAALEAIGTEPDWQALAAAWPDGRIKLALTRCLLGLRAEFAALFTDGAYHPLEVKGRDRDHVLAFARSHMREAVIVAVGRHFGVATQGGRRWAAGATWEAAVDLDEFTDISDALMPQRTFPPHPISVGTLFGPIPVAVLRAVPQARADMRDRTLLRSRGAVRVT
jgi:(1->4)-alpha-D-glucan 1-alpha-D-glucosylmutase